MNRLIIIGNGFDLAHGLKTSYKDFIADYLFEVINKYSNNFDYSDPLLSLTNGFNIGKVCNIESLSIENSIERFTSRILNDTIYTLKIQRLFYRTISSISKYNWVDLESFYFSELSRILNDNSYKLDKEEQIQELNVGFDFMKIELQKYLIKLTESTNWNDLSIPEYNELFFSSRFKPNTFSKNITFQSIGKVLFLNFNYTKTISLYTSSDKSIQSYINNIHGTLNSTENPVIFGFGDEHNIEYKKFEDSQDSKLFKHMKSFSYLYAANYSKLIDFIDAENYEVQVFGHSLGLSDRTMLKEIFEHSNCKEIKIYYHKKEDGNNDFLDKLYNLSSHFSDKSKMRRKVVSFELSEHMPQILKKLSN